MLVRLLDPKGKKNESVYPHYHAMFYPIQFPELPTTHLRVPHMQMTPAFVIHPFLSFFLSDTCQTAKTKKNRIYFSRETHLALLYERAESQFISIHLLDWTN